MPLFHLDRPATIQAVLFAGALAGPVLAALAGSPARASATPAILHGSVPAAVECFKLAARNAPPPARSIDVCTQALEGRAADEEIRAATLVNRALIQRRLGQVTAAVSDCDAALSMALTGPEAAVTCAAVFINAGEPERAITLLDGAPLPKGSQRYKAYHNLALAHHDLGQYGEAYHFIEKTLAAKPRFAPALALKQQYRVDRSPIAK